MDPADPDAPTVLVYPAVPALHRYDDDRDDDGSPWDLSWPGDLGGEHVPVTLAEHLVAEHLFHGR